jgi:PilZ domain
VRDVDWTAARELRRKAYLDVVTHRCDGTSCSVIVTDLSRDGCQFRTDVQFDVGEFVELKHELLGSLSAEVRWACAGRVGLKFVRAI